MTEGLIIAVFGVILAAVYILLQYQRIFTGPRPEITVPDLDVREKTVSALLIAAMLFLGFGPAPVLDVVEPVARSHAELIVVESTDGASADAALSVVEGSTK